MKPTSLSRVTFLAFIVLAHCAAPAPSPVSTAAVEGATSDLSFDVRASKATKSQLGVARWHTIVEPESNAIVVDGADAKGRVLFTTVLRSEDADGSYRVETHDRDRSTLVMNGRTGDVVTNTLPAEHWSAYASAYAADWKARPATARYEAADDRSLGVPVAAGAVSAMQILAGVFASAITGVGPVVVTDAARRPTRAAVALPNLQNVLSQFTRIFSTMRSTFPFARGISGGRSLPTPRSGPVSSSASGRTTGSGAGSGRANSTDPRDLDTLEEDIIEEDIIEEELIDDGGDFASGTCRQRACSSSTKVCICTHYGATQR